MNWLTAFSHVPSLHYLDTGLLVPSKDLHNIVHVQDFLQYAHIKFCLLKPFAELEDYPLVDARDLLPSFEPALYEYTALPGFSLVVFDRPINYFQEIFQFDLLHTCRDPHQPPADQACVLPAALAHENQEQFLRHLPRSLREDFKERTTDLQVADLRSYSVLIQYLGYMDRAHVLSADADGAFYLSGIYASLPSDLDAELKRFGLRIKKFRPHDNQLYERNREFVYRFLMELYGYPISSERTTSAALFARRLHKMGERFFIKVLGQSDRTLTTIRCVESDQAQPVVEKTALIRVESRNAELVRTLERDGYFIDPARRVAILHVVYRQHNYDPHNVRQDRALSVMHQELIHPLTGARFTSGNIIKDSYSMSLKLNDIVRGEFSGRVQYKGEIIENTETHAKRLKFLYAWLNKHQRRMISYSDEFYQEITQVLDEYLQRSELADEFAETHDLYQEVRSASSFIKQARNIKLLEDLARRQYKGQKISYATMLTLSTELLAELKYEFINYFDTLVFKAIYFSNAILNNRYLVRTYIAAKEEHLTAQGLHIRKLYRRLVALVDELHALRKIKSDA